MTGLLFPSVVGGILGVLYCGVPILHADSWQLTMQTGENQNVWLVHEKLGVRMQIPAQPELEVILRADRHQTIWVHSRLGVYALQPWNPGGVQRGGAPIVDPRAAKAMERADGAVKKLSSRAQAAAQRNLAKRYGRMTDGQTGRADMRYERTGKTRQIGKHATFEIVEFAHRQPTGRSFWVADYPGWEKLATALQQAVDNFALLAPNQRIPFKELGGIAIEMIEADGTMSQLTDIRLLPISPAMMQPDLQFQQVEFAALMQQVGL